MSLVGGPGGQRTGGGQLVLRAGGRDRLGAAVGVPGGPVPVAHELVHDLAVHAFQMADGSHMTGAGIGQEPLAQAVPVGTEPVARSVIDPATNPPGDIDMYNTELLMVIRASGLGRRRAQADGSHMRERAARGALRSVSPPRRRSGRSRTARRS